jgi:hypothetical protein
VYQPLLIKAQDVGETCNCRFRGLPTPLPVEVAVKTLSFLVACSAFVCVLAMTSSDARVSAHAVDCGGEPCDAVVRGALAFVDRRLDGLGANGRSCADCHMPSDQFQLSPQSAERRFQFLRFLRLWNARADDPLFRPIDADDFRSNGDRATDFSNLRQNGLVRVTLPLPSNIRLVDAATNLPSNETFVDVWRMVPSVNDVALTGADGTNPWFRGPNTTGGYQLDARVSTLQDQALGALVNHAQIQQPPAQGLLDDLASFQRVLFTNHRVRTLAMRCATVRRRSRIPIRRSMTSNSRARPCSCAPALTVTAAPGSPRPRPRWFASMTLRRSARVPSIPSHQRASRLPRARHGWRAMHGPTRFC